MAKIFPSKRPAAAPDLIERNEQKFGEEALAGAKPNESVHAARAPPARLGVRLLSKREVLAITNVSYPTVWSCMRQGMFPRSRVVGGKSMWVSAEIEAWMAALPRCRLKGDGEPVPTPTTSAERRRGRPGN